MNKIISLKLARMVVVLAGTGTSQNVPHINDSITHSRSALNINSKGALTANRLSRWLPDLAPDRIHSIYSWLIRNNIVDDNLYVSGYYLNNKIKVLHQLSQVFNRNVATHVSHLLEKIINEVRLPRSLRDYRMNAHAMIRLEKPLSTEDHSDWDGILIDIPPVFPVSFLQMVMGIERLLRHPRLSSKVKKEIKQQVPILDEIGEGFPVPLISTVLYTHDHYDHMGGTDAFRELREALGQNLSVYATKNVLDKIRRFSTELFKPVLISVDLKKDWQSECDRINKELRLNDEGDIFFPDIDINNMDHPYFREIKNTGLIPFIHPLTTEFIKDKVTDYLTLNLQLLESQQKTDELNGEYDAQINEKIALIKQQLIEVWKHGRTLNSKHFMSGILKGVNLEMAFPSGMVTTRAVQAEHLRSKGPIERYDWLGNHYVYENDPRRYGSIRIGKFNTTVIPLDIHHGPDWERIHINPKNWPTSSFVTQFIKDKEQTEIKAHKILGWLFPEYRFAYITDAMYIPKHTMNLLRNAKLKHLVINGLWPIRKHLSHLSMEEVIDIAMKIGVEHTHIIHCTNKIYYQETNEYLHEKMRYLKLFALIHNILDLLESQKLILLRNRIMVDLDTFLEHEGKVLPSFISAYDRQFRYTASLQYQLTIILRNENALMESAIEKVIGFLPENIQEQVNNMREHQVPKTVELAYDNQKIHIGGDEDAE